MLGQCEKLISESKSHLSLLKQKGYDTKLDEIKNGALKKAEASVETASIMYTSIGTDCYAIAPTRRSLDGKRWL